MKNNQNASGNKVYLSGKQIELEEETFEELNSVIKDLVLGCDDFYTQLVTNNFVQNIRENEKYIEIHYADKFRINIGNREKLWIDRIFIPLDGKFQSNQEVTFFFGEKGYSGQPYINTTGFGNINRLIQELNR